MVDNFKMDIMGALDMYSGIAAMKFSKHFSGFPEGASDQEKICQINTYWRYQLCGAPTSSLKVRTYLGDDMDISTWLEYFKVFVAPFIAKNDLPNLNY